MKKLILSLLTVTSLFASSCSEKIEVHNLSGTDWYGTTVCLYETDTTGTDMLRYEDVGTVKIGESFEFTKENDNEFYYLILAKDIKGNSIGSVHRVVMAVDFLTNKELVSW